MGPPPLAAKAIIELIECLESRNSAAGVPIATRGLHRHRSKVAVLYQTIMPVTI
jgi:hypothetical protein